MSQRYAKEFRDIPLVLTQNSELREAILSLVKTDPIPGKATEGGNRTDVFKGLLANFFKGKANLDITINETESSLPRALSPHSDSNRVFAKGWAERLVRTQVSRFYNQAVLQQILANGQTSCLVHHSSDESDTSNCSQLLAGTTQDPSVLLARLTTSYRDGNWTSEVKIPDHPHCTHTVMPASE